MVKDNIEEDITNHNKPYFLCFVVDDLYHSLQKSVHLNTMQVIVISIFNMEFTLLPPPQVSVFV